MKQKIQEITHEAGMANCDSHSLKLSKLSDRRYEEIEAKYNEAQVLLSQQWNLPLEQKLELLEGLKMRDSDKILGLAPKDFHLLKKLGLIDFTNNVEEEEQEDQQEAKTKDFNFENDH